MAIDFLPSAITCDDIAKASFYRLGKYVTAVAWHPGQLLAASGSQELIEWNRS
jgi:hypothetical protein